MEGSPLATSTAHDLSESLADAAASSSTKPETGTRTWADAVTPEVEARLMRVVETLEPLPVLDGTVMRVLALLGDEESSTGDIVEALVEDATFAANVLRYANSAHNARPIRAQTIRQAVAMVGRRNVKRLSLEAATYRFLERAPGNGRISRGQMHVHASAVASCAAATAQKAGASADVAHLAGLLHDVGKLVLPIAYGEAALDALALEAAAGAERSSLEWRRLGVDHAHAGALFARRSNVGEDVVEAIALHHGGRAGLAIKTPEIACVQIADTVVGILNGLEPNAELMEAALAKLGLDAAELDDLAKDAVQQRTGLQLGGIADRVRDLERLAQTDDLTGLANRRHWLQVARTELGDAGEGSVLVCDVDEFKSVNDQHGHAAGDLVLTELARILAHHGTAGRLGGDEFAVWLGQTPVHLATERAEAIVNEVTAAFPTMPGVPRVGVSVGVAVAPAHGTDIASLLEAADSALYAAKAGGRGRAILAT